MNESYVKFVRGTPQAYERLAQKSPDTLYLIREKGAKLGSLYLGDTLIAQGASIDAIGLDSIEDININTETLNDGDVLVYDYATKKWVNKPQGETAKLDVSFEAGKDLSVNKEGMIYTFSHNEILTSIVIPEEHEDGGQLVVSNLEVDNGHITKIIYSYISNIQPQSKLEWGTF